MDQQLDFVFSKGGAEVSQFHIKLGQGLVGWVTKSGKGIICNDVTKDARFFDKIDEQTGFYTKSVLCAPLKQLGTCIGAIEVLNTTHPDGFSEADLKFLTTFGGLTGASLERAKRFTTTNNVNVAFEEAIHNHYRFVIGDSEAMKSALQTALTVAQTKTTVLLLGESGTGKEVMARAIHTWSPRVAHPFIAVNCVALTPELIESELFGHERGAFTGAISQKKGKFELGHGGTVFLDEIGDLPAALQTRLLRVLQEREFQRVGGSKNIHADVRIIAATNRDLYKAMQSGAFREDLYYRLNVVSVTMPPLRDRKNDIPGLVEHFSEKFCREVKRPTMSVHPDIMALLTSYHWPGNVRELQNAIERAVVLSNGPSLTQASLPAEIWKSVETNPTAPNGVLCFADAVQEFKWGFIRKTLKNTGGNQMKAAKVLGLGTSNLSRIMKDLGLR